MERKEMEEKRMLGEEWREEEIKGKGMEKNRGKKGGKKRWKGRKFR